MRAVGCMELGAPSVLRPLEIDRPACGERQVLIRTEGVSVNYADLQTRRGAYHAGGTQFPVIPGLDVTGTVEEVGVQVRTLRPGQRVIAFPHTGSYADFVAADEDLTFPVPESVSLEQAIACPLVTFTSRMLLEKVARLSPGETLVIHAASGGIGTTVIQMARLMGAGTIIGTVGSRGKTQAALDAGADRVVCLEDGGFSEQVLAQTGGRGADVILDSLGGTYTNEGLSCLVPYGRLVVFGNASRSYSELNTSALHASCRSVLGFSIGSTRKLRPAWFQDVAPAVLEDLALGRIRIPVAARFPLEEAARAHALLEERRITGKVILTV
ncbi:MAG: NADPH:quinone oxidoreductase family protein [Oscillibacter sp.]|nr:NADPH:quinone oxidoreductase family protein [Oscillibacter sp.]